jgi:hypothetical protein
MLLPHRDGDDLDAPLELKPLPNGPWEGKIAYLDRDGVLNQGSENYINSPDELVILPGVSNSIGGSKGSRFPYLYCDESITNRERDMVL